MVALIPEVNPTLAEVLAFRQAILLVKDEDFNNVVIEGDAPLFKRCITDCQTNNVNIIIYKFNLKLSQNLGCSSEFGCHPNSWGEKKLALITVSEPNISWISNLIFLAGSNCSQLTEMLASGHNSSGFA